MPHPRLTPLLLLVVALHLLVAGWFAWQRPIDGDEGYYGLAARLVSEGDTPYADFFYPQRRCCPTSTPRWPPRWACPSYRIYERSQSC